MPEPVGRGADLIIADLNGTGFMDGVGCGILVGALRYAREHDCGFGVACGSEPILRLFRMTALNKVLDIRPAVADFSSKTEVTSA